MKDAKIYAERNETRRSIMVTSVKKMLHHLADELPDNATWGDVAYQVELKASIEQGLKEADAG
ncbi:MAG: hypothetical protein GY820_07245, partial [Gammaproteobacteria bacterium]|nr:hypothetical protein [Gammaproteobacteria bacterium]